MIPVAFLFPGQLSEFVGMGRDFYEADPEARRLFREASRRSDRDLERILLEGPEEDLHENLAAQAGVYLVSTLACRALAERGIRPAATAGYSLGNYAAFVAAGAVSFEEGLEVLIAVWRETERLSISRRDGGGDRRSARGRGGNVRGLEGPGAAGLDRQRQLEHSIRPDGGGDGRRSGADGSPPQGAIGSAAFHEMADSQRADGARWPAPSVPWSRLAGRFAIPKFPFMGPTARWSNGGKEFASSWRRNSCTRRSGTRLSSRWSGPGFGRFWRSGRGKCSLACLVGLTGP